MGVHGHRRSRPAERPRALLAALRRLLANISSRHRQNGRASGIGQKRQPQSNECGSPNTGGHAAPSAAARCSLPTLGLGSAPLEEAAPAG